MGAGKYARPSSIVPILALKMYIIKRINCRNVHDHSSQYLSNICSSISLLLDRLNREKPTTMRKLEDIWYEGNGSSWENRNAHYNSSRYHMLNLHATFTKGTIEFRLFQFADPADGKRNGLHAGEMKAYIQLCLAMSQLAKMVRTASPKPQQTDNEKYAMRCWMLRLGFIGDEFATAREILLRNMEGNASWRNK